MISSGEVPIFVSKSRIGLVLWKSNPAALNASSKRLAMRGILLFTFSVTPFIRPLVGLDREAAKHVFDGFQAARTLSANQIEFLNLVIDYLTERGVMEPRLLYESPFTDLDALGVEGVFDGASVIVLIGILDDVQKRAAA